MSPSHERSIVRLCGLACGAVSGVAAFRSGHLYAPGDALAGVMFGVAGVAIVAMSWFLPARAAEQVCHVEVVRRETAAVEHRGGLGLAVDTLLAQYGDRRAHTARDVRGRDVIPGIEAEGDLEGRLLRGAHRGKFLVRTLRVIAQPPQLPRGLRPGAPQLHQALIE